MSEWREYRLSEVIEKFIDYRGKTPTKTAHGIPLITAKIVKEGKILEANEFIAEKDYDSWMTRGLPEINDVVLTTEAPLGEVALIKDKKVALAQRIITLRGKKEKIDNVFLKYYFQSKDGQHELQSRASGTTVFGIKSSVLQEVPILLPPLAEQKAIAGVLSALDDKIDLLHRQNKTLEAMAEALFRQWFVVEAEESWEEGSILDLIELVGGGTPKTEVAEYWNGNIGWLSGGDITDNHKSFVINSSKNISEMGLNNSSAKILPENSLVISARGTVGKFCILSQPMAFSQSNYGIIPNNSKNYFFTYLLLNYAIEELKSSAYGSVFDTITTTTFRDLNVSLPPKDEITLFEKSIVGNFIKMKANCFQIRSLEKLRDTLLPKLMSGEVRVEM
ncbi:restriction endonuclease subunit S [Leptospira sp. 2 VSF19]|uniref:Restriction endonuclease subunit S n=1 Tax=Leptospira soteropolitanensis TaxID=2950025 RepID=A0AAW5VH75_9LEPT|nr:restriction endonuclease subunit S [Leptospira soteropolitanensis]MCW7494629.1 restriction endonuclease subunit S [Leptospira soteropolitanensis]MCW7502203.1 restriction endonuclease subunit S [Leptospira soteropolitanensis]MCW7524475.1 restriction endonuclease subunit S [Leptospira soteropolitanensis]MCW7528341.1 restriction endonuclease subunit S [Leptospira soteropolitanensis]MCW7532194.1 restriction endonuclease subunit S [Leptospira soteropolitanensis]